MLIGYDPQKNAWNIQQRGMSFEDVSVLDWGTAIIRQDKRRDYGEERFQALVEGADGKPYIVVFTMRGETFWIISFRRAHERERKTYAKEA
jgi:uncharacterized DUF497 family protein